MQSFSSADTAQSVKTTAAQEPTTANEPQVLLSASKGGGLPEVQNSVGSLWRNAINTLRNCNVSDAVGKGFPRTRTRREVEARGLMHTSSALRISV